VTALNSRQVLIAPVVSEKSYSLIEDNKYSFRVHPRAHKTQIRHAVEELFDVQVRKVNTLNRKGKRVRDRRTRKFGHRPDRKRAIVSLVEGDTIDLFQE
jgi:large subunit ribosomal protein L23